MTFDGRQRSLSDGKPVRLYEIQHGLSTWRYCSGDREQVTGSFIWRPLLGGMQDEGIRQSGDAASDTFTIQAASDLPVVRLFRTLPPTTEIAVVVRDMHVGDDEQRVVWVGSISQVNRRGIDRVEIVCEHLLASMARSGLAISWERGCPYSVYDHNCGVNRDLFRVDTTLSNVTATTIESPAFAAFESGWYAGGFVEWQDEHGVVERRFVKGHDGAVLMLLGGTPNMSSGQLVRAFAGCDRTAQTCLDKFDNIDNNGGFPMLPGKSPFDGDLLW